MPFWIYGSPVYRAHQLIKSIMSAHHCRDLTESEGVASGIEMLGEYQLHDLVQLSHELAGVVVKIEKDACRVRGAGTGSARGRGPGGGACGTSTSLPDGSDRQHDRAYCKHALAHTQRKVRAAIPWLLLPLLLSVRRCLRARAPPSSPTCGCAA